MKDEVEQYRTELGNMQEKYDNLKERYGRVRNFVVNRIGKIPFVGKRVLHMLEEDLQTNTLDNVR